MEATDHIVLEDAETSTEDDFTGNKIVQENLNRHW